MIENIYKNPVVGELLSDPSDDVVITDEGLICTHMELTDEMITDLAVLGIMIEEAEQVFCG